MKVVIQFYGSDSKKVYSILAAIHAVTKIKTNLFSFGVGTRVTFYVNDIEDFYTAMYILNKNTTYGVKVIRTSYTWREFFNTIKEGIFNG